MPYSLLYELYVKRFFMLTRRMLTRRILARRTLACLTAAAASSGAWPVAEAAALRRTRSGPYAEKPLVMIDPGHGGHDPGCIGAGGVMEKTITLETGFALRDALLRSRRCRVGMTRTRDVFVSLPDRVALAVKARADLFIALHCNFLSNPAMRGALVFTLSQKPSDALAAAIAGTENSYDRAPLSPHLRGVSPAVAGILASLTARATRIGSKHIAHTLVDEFRTGVLLLPDPNRSANFAVLRDPLIPSTLIEMGCLSNEADTMLLRTPHYRALLATRMTGAAERWLADSRLLGVAG
jgi:N-acetylmuramoyl-L-alanine amidase